MNSVKIRQRVKVQNNNIIYYGIVFSVVSKSLPISDSISSLFLHFQMTFPLVTIREHNLPDTQLSINITVSDIRD